MQTHSLVVNADEKKLEWTLGGKNRNQRLMIVPSLACFCPVLDGTRAEVKLTGIKRQAGRMTFRFQGPALKEYEVHLQATLTHLEISSRFIVTADCELNRLELFPSGTGLNLYDLVNFRNRHFTPQTWPELNFGGKGFETDTYSTDWQFAPHPTMFILRKDNAHLFFGALDLPKAFGMYLKVADYRVQHWYLDYGPSGFGQKLKAGEVFESPRFGLFLEHGKSVHETISRWTHLLIQQGLIPDPKKKQRFDWHTENLYCTWVDQVGLSEAKIAAELYEQAEGAATAMTVMNEKLVRRALEVIHREHLPFRTVLLDAGWMIERGQWEPHPQRFPNLRKLVDDIHASGMKVVVWWAWPEIDDDAKVNPDHLIGNGKRYRHGRRLWDFSNPQTQREYLEPLFHKLISSDPGCYDLDGVKTDFIADKVHADMPVHDPAWRGEENYFYRFYRLFHAMMRRHKPDACHHAYSGHPYLAPFIDVNRTADVHSSDVREHLNRGLMLRATTPGCPVDFDFHTYMDNFDTYFAVARRHGFFIQIGNILVMKRDLLAPWEPANAAFYRLLRTNLPPLCPAKTDKMSHSASRKSRLRSKR